ncbi:hypothetical protein K1719_046513 [Acacia pycnantha]|nr:hypothetical protein K1719_046513 [Acacia pycnantha]
MNVAETRHISLPPRFLLLLFLPANPLPVCHSLIPSSQIIVVCRHNLSPAKNHVIFPRPILFQQLLSPFITHFYTITSLSLPIYPPPYMHSFLNTKPFNLIAIPFSSSSGGRWSSQQKGHHFRETLVVRSKCSTLPPTQRTIHQTRRSNLSQSGKLGWSHQPPPPTRMRSPAHHGWPSRTPIVPAADSVRHSQRAT